MELFHFDLKWLITGAVTAGCILKFYLWFNTGKCRSSESMKGKTVIITGATSGIGKETARQLAKLDGRIVLACRSVERGMETAREIISTTGNTNVIVKLLDLSSIKSVQTFCREINKTEERLDVLINNAGMLGPPQHILTEDGIEMTMATNYFGHYILTLLLLDLLKLSAPSRIINVSSNMYSGAKIDFEDLNSLKNYHPVKVYRNSKLANILFTLELNQRLKGTGVTVNSLHPGIVRTGITKNYSGLIIIIVRILLLFFGKNAEDGAQTSIFLASSREVEGISGKYFTNCKETQLKSNINYKLQAKNLWDASMEMYKIIENE